MKKKCDLGKHDRHRQSPPTSWRWQEGAVLPSGEHFALYYGSANDSDWKRWPLVARIGLVEVGLVNVEFLVDRADAAFTQPLAEVTREIDYYIVEKRERHPWSYAAYHCTTASNLYSHVHWAYVRPGRGLPAEPE